MALGMGCAKPRVAVSGPMDALPADVKQALVVTAPAGGDVKGVNVHIHWYERRGESWHHAGVAIGICGKNGFAKPGEKVEGDGKSPSGTFAIGPAFGAPASCETKLEYRQMFENDYWIDDPESPKYNQLVTGEKPKVSHEEMLRKDTLYKYGAVIRYNMDPVVPGKGSAIFLHVWEPGKNSTAGCIALTEPALKPLLEWLDARKNPRILMNVDGGDAPVK